MKPPLLFIVAWNRPDLWDYLRRWFAEVGGVQVLLDRRRGERRRRVASHEPERRRVGRRHQPHLEDELRSSGFVITRSWRIVPLLLMAVVVLIGVGVPGLTRAENANGAGTATAVSGLVTVTRVAAAAQPLKFGDALFWGDVVEAHKGGSARLWLATSTTVTVKEFSRLELRKEARAAGLLYTLELLRGKLRVSVARMLLPQGERVEVWTRNAVASVRGTEFSVETVEPLVQARVFGFLGARSRSPSVETVVSTLSGLVDVSPRWSGGGWVARIGATETLRVNGAHAPVLSRLRAKDLKVFLQGTSRR